MALKRVFAVDIGTHSVKVVEVARGRRGFRVRRVGEAETTGEGSIPEAVRQAMRRARIRRGPCVVGLPRSQVVLRRLRGLPAALSDAELLDVARLQAESELPFPPGSAVFDFTNIRRTDEGTALEVIAAEIEEVERYLQPVREAGGRPIAVVPSVFGLATLVRHHFAGNGELHRILALSVGYTTTDVALIHGDRTVFSRSFPVGARDLEAEPTRGVQQFLDQLRLTVRAYRRDRSGENATSEDTWPFEEIWLFGGGAAVPIASAAEEDAPERPLRLADLLRDQFPVSVRFAFPVQDCEHPGPLAENPIGWALYGTAIGYAVAALEEAVPINLLPPVELRRRVQTERNRRLVLLAGTTAALFLAVFLIGNRVQSRYLAQIRALDAQIAQYRTGRAAASSSLAELRALSDFLKPRYTQLDVLREVTAILPDRRPIAATSMTVEPSGRVTISFDAQSHEAVTEAITRLAQSAWFTDVRPGSIVTAQKENRPVRQFTVTIQLAADADVLAAKRVGTPYTPEERKGKRETPVAQEGSETDRPEEAGGRSSQDRAEAIRAARAGADRPGRRIAQDVDATRGENAISPVPPAGLDEGEGPPPPVVRKPVHIEVEIEKEEKVQYGPPLSDEAEADRVVDESDTPSVSDEER